MSERIHFVGIGGAGMSGLARVLARQGEIVSGSDQRESPTLDALRREDGIRADAGHDEAHVQGVDLVVVSAAVRRDNPEILAARAQGIRIISRAEMLGRLMARYPASVAISGTHGKTTTTGMTALILEAAALDPTVLIGGDLPAFGGNARLGDSEVFLAEACEAYDSFLDLSPRVAVITNVEADHLDYYGDMENILRSFRKFLSQVSGTAVFCADDRYARQLAEDTRGLPHGPAIVTYGFTEEADIRATDADLGGPRPSFTLTHQAQELGRVTLSVPGRHNVSNALAAAAAGLTLGVPFAAIADGLSRFTGTGRRFEILGDTPSGVTVVDDYAHHPTEIRATLSAARAAYGDRRLIAVFQPHLASRTSDFQEQFAEAFGDADLVVLTEIYLAREQAREGVSGANLAALTADRRGAEAILYLADKSHIAARLRGLTEPGDVVLTLGAGDIRQVAEEFLRTESE